MVWEVAPERYMNNETILKYALLAGAVYFCCVSIAHFTGTKIPGLFVYYNIPSYQYQDTIIAFLAFGWSAFLYAGSQQPEIIRPILLSALVALVGLIYNTVSTDFDAITGAATDSTPFWIQIFLLSCYAGWLWVFAARTGLKRSAYSKDSRT